VQQRGTVDHTPLYPREIAKRALELAASAIIMVHNHPSGDPTPSRADLDMTKQVVTALSAVGITVHDHVIVGKNKHTSFKSQRLIWATSSSLSFLKSARTIACRRLSTTTTACPSSKAVQFLSIWRKRAGNCSPGNLVRGSTRCNGCSGKQQV
jgi:hypothetical protein